MTEESPLDKAGLCLALGWSKPKLDRRLDGDANFPVRKRGTQAGGWEFDLSVVLAYLAAEPQKPRRPGRPSGAQQEAAEKTESPAARLPAVGHRGEETAKQRRDEAQAALLEDKLKKDRGALVEAEEVRITVGNMLAHLCKGLDSLPDIIVKRLRLSEEAGIQIGRIVDEVRLGMATDLEKLLAEP